MAKKKKLVTLISPYGYDDLGLRQVHAFLKSKKVEVKLIFFKDWIHWYSFRQIICGFKKPLDKEMDELVELVKGSDLVGISVVSTLYKVAKQITEKIQKELGTKVIWGGSHAIVNPEECIKTADYVCIGEGENTLYQLSKGEPLNKIENLWYKRKGKVVKNKRGKLVNVEKMPNLDYSNKEKYIIDFTCSKQERMDYISDERYKINNKGVGNFDPMNINPHLTYMTSRGCPFTCDFCSNNIFRKLYKGCGPFLRRKSVNKVIEELKEIIKYRKRVDAIIFLDDLFLTDIEWIKKFSKRYRKEINLPFVVEAFPNSINEENISALSKAGLIGASVGIQHWKGVRENLFNRFTPDKQIFKADRILHKYGVKPKYDFVVDIPGETENDKEELLNLILKLKRPFELNLFSAIHFPGTDLTKKLLGRGLISEKDIEGEAMIGDGFSVDIKVKEKRDLYKSLILVYTHLGIRPSIIKKLYNNKIDPWRLLYLIDFSERVKYSFYDLLKIFELYYPLRKIYRKKRLEKKELIR
ncbi:MAG: radical SAM protein [Candidatus Pacearchaeota archaeon]|jgi:radical SAM superfamily enzyme YgiQ (UPF0313 family)